MFQVFWPSWGLKLAKFGPKSPKNMLKLPISTIGEKRHSTPHKRTPNDETEPSDITPTDEFTIRTTSTT